MGGHKLRNIEACESSFMEIMTRLAIAPVLVFLNIHRCFSIHYDASQHGIKVGVMQEGMIVAYASRRPHEHEERCPSHDLELIAMVHALMIWSHHLDGHRCEIYDDYQSLRFIFTQPSLDLRQH